MIAGEQAECEIRASVMSMVSQEGVVWENEGEIASYLWNATGLCVQGFRASIKIENTSVLKEGGDETVRKK